MVSNLEANNVMVILDNHISEPSWCCSAYDGRGFFGDIYFNPDLWIEGLTQMAAFFKGVPNVVGMSSEAKDKICLLGTGIWSSFCIFFFIIIFLFG